MSISKKLECIDSNVSSQEWLKCLSTLDNDIMKMYNKFDCAVIISSPYSVMDIKSAMKEFIYETYHDESMLFCFDIVMTFIIPEKRIIKNKLKTYCGNHNNMNLLMNKYNTLLSTEAIIVINTLKCTYLSIPRNINQISRNWAISWQHNDAMDDIYSEISNKIANNYLSKHFISNDWSKRINFTGVTYVGFLCDNGEIARGDMLRQKGNKIFVHFNTDRDHYGKKHDWIQIPNNRICPPPERRPKRLSSVLNYQTYPTTPVSNYYTNQQDDDLQRAIAASLRDVNNNETDDTDDFLQLAIKRSLQENK